MTSSVRSLLDDGSVSERIVVAHQDDVGMCHGANVAFDKLAGNGFITSGSVMVPCPWFLEVAGMAQKRPELDIGVHLTLTSEWRQYRWRPLTGVGKSSGLVDADGYMWPSVKPVRENAVLEAVEAELRAQIDAALKADIDITHLDTHMGATLAPEYVEIYLRLGRDYNVPVVMTRQFAGYGCASTFGTVDPSKTDACALELERSGVPLFDAFYESPWAPASESRTAYEQLVDGIKPGLTFLAMHCNASGDIETIDPERAHCRTDELNLFQDPAFIARVHHLGIKLIGFREIRDMVRGKAAQAAN